MNSKMILRSTIAALALSAAAGPAAADGGGFFGRWQAPSVLEGPWQVTITPASCDTGEEFPQFTFVSYLTFAAGGTLIESTSNRGFQPGQRSPGHGYWERTGRKSYHAHFQAFVLFDSAIPVTPPNRPYQRGKQTLDQTMEFQDSNHWTSDAQVTFVDSAGATVDPSGCAKATAERMP